MHPHVHSWIIQDSKNVEATKMSFNRWLGIQIMGENTQWGTT